MQWWQAVLLGVVQGLTEFLPVSSSGHLYLIESWLQIPEAISFSFSVFVHLGTLGAVLFYFKQEILDLSWKKIQNIFIGMLPIIGVGFIFYDLLSNLSGYLWLSITFGITAMLLLLAETILHTTNPNGLTWRLINRIHYFFTDEQSPNWLQALGIGFLQALAILPGVSRSGATLTGSLIAGLPRQQAFSFSFILGVPTIMAAIALDLLSLLGSGKWTQIPWSMMLIGVFVSAITGWLALGILHWFWKQEKLWPFALYCGFVSVLLVLFA